LAFAVYPKKEDGTTIVDGDTSSGDTSGGNYGGFGGDDGFDYP